MTYTSQHQLTNKKIPKLLPHENLIGVAHEKKEPKCRLFDSLWWPGLSSLRTSWFLCINELRMRRNMWRLDWRFDERAVDGFLDTVVENSKVEIISINKFKVQK